MLHSYARAAFTCHGEHYSCLLMYAEGLYTHASRVDMITSMCSRQRQRFHRTQRKMTDFNTMFSRLFILEFAIISPKILWPTSLRRRGNSHTIKLSTICN